MRLRSSGGRVNNQQHDWGVGAVDDVCATDRRLRPCVRNVRFEMPLDVPAGNPYTWSRRGNANLVWLSEYVREVVITAEVMRGYSKRAAERPQNAGCRVSLVRHPSIKHLAIHKSVHGTDNQALYESLIPLEDQPKQRDSNAYRLRLTRGSKAGNAPPATFTIHYHCHLHHPLSAPVYCFSEDASLILSAT